MRSDRGLWIYAFFFHWRVCQYMGGIWRDDRRRRRGVSLSDHADLFFPVRAAVSGFRTFSAPVDFPRRHLAAPRVFVYDIDFNGRLRGNFLDSASPAMDYDKLSYSLIFRGRMDRFIT